MIKKYIIVTGAAGVLGQAVAKSLAENGYEIIAIDRAQTIPNSTGFRLSLPNIDLTEWKNVQEIFSEISGLCQRLDGLVNIAGGFCWGKIEDGDVKTWDFMYKINVRTAFLMSKAAIPFLKHDDGSSAIINVSAAASLNAGPGMGAYAAAKSAVSRLTESLAAELKDNNIRVNAVLPSILDTPANRRDMPDDDFERWVNPQSLSKVIAFLLSDHAEAITGALIPVTGRVSV